jgi:hypothetical protein
MITDPIVERLHKQREKHMELFQYDFDAIVREIRAHEASCLSPLLEPPASPTLNTPLRRTRFTRR